MEKKIHISVVSPVYKAENIIEELVKQIKQSLISITDDFEIILVNDCSPDNSWQSISKECEKDKRIKGINLSKNFGQHNAITAGLNQTNGEWIVVMDCDLQDQPEEIINLYTKAQEGWDSVFAKRVNRNDSTFKKLFSRLFYKIFSYLTDTKQDSTVANFGIYRNCVIDAVLSMNDQIRYFPTMVQWVGFNKYYLPVEHSIRYEGTSTYNFKSLFHLAINTAIAFSDKPLRLTVKIGFYITLFSFIISLVYFISYFTGHINVSGFTSLILSLWFLAGIIILILGILGLYLGKLFETVKKRPIYIIKDFINEK